MKKQQKNTLWVRVICWFLAALMLLSISTYIIYAILGLM